MLLQSLSISDAHAKGLKQMIAVIKKNTVQIASIVNDKLRSINPVQISYPSIRWADNKTHVFIGIKYAPKFDSPGYLEMNIKNEEAHITSTQIYLSADIQEEEKTIRYLANFTLIKEIEQENSSLVHESVGRIYVILKKVVPQFWPKLSYESILNLGTWWEMKEKYTTDDNSEDMAQIRKQKRMERKNGKHVTKICKRILIIKWSIMVPIYIHILMSAVKPKVPLTTQLDTHIEEVLNSIKIKTKLIGEENQSITESNTEILNQQTICNAQKDKLTQKLQELTQKKEMLVVEIKQLEEQQGNHNKEFSNAKLLQCQICTQYNDLAKQYQIQLRDIEESEKHKQQQRVEQANSNTKLIALTQFKYDNQHRTLAQLIAKHRELQKECETKLELDNNRKTHLLSEEDKLSSLYHRVSVNSNNN